MNRDEKRINPPRPPATSRGTSMRRRCYPGERSNVFGGMTAWPGCVVRASQVENRHGVRHALADRADHRAARRLADLAIQRGVGLLPQWWRRVAADHCDPAPRRRTHIGRAAADEIAQSSVARAAWR